MNSCSICKLKATYMENLGELFEQLQPETCQSLPHRQELSLPKCC